MERFVASRIPCRILRWLLREIRATATETHALLGNSLVWLCLVQCFGIVDLEFSDRTARTWICPFNSCETEIGDSESLTADRHLCWGELQNPPWESWCNLIHDWSIFHSCLIHISSMFHQCLLNVSSMFRQQHRFLDVSDKCRFQNRVWVAEWQNGREWVRLWYEFDNFRKITLFTRSNEAIIAFCQHEVCDGAQAHPMDCKTAMMGSISVIGSIRYRLHRDVDTLAVVEA
jgi:hypothetical protein